MLLTNNVVRDIRDEWARAEASYPDATVASAVWTDAERLVILAEEVGEVAEAVSLTLGEHPPNRDRNLRAELVQVAAVALAWVQRIDLDSAGAGCQQLADEL